MSVNELYTLSLYIYILILGILSNYILRYLFLYSSKPLINIPVKVDLSFFLKSSKHFKDESIFDKYLDSVLQNDTIMETTYFKLQKKYFPY